MSVLETAIMKLSKKNVGHDNLLAEIDREYASDFEALHEWTESRWDSYGEAFVGDPTIVRKFLPIELDKVPSLPIIVDKIAKQGFRKTLAQTNQENYQETLNGLLITLYHPVVLDSLYCRVYSGKNIPDWVSEM